MSQSVIQSCQKAEKKSTPESNSCDTVGLPDSMIGQGQASTDEVVKRGEVSWQPDEGDKRAL